MALSHSSQSSDAPAQQHAKNEAFLDHVKGVIASVAAATTKDSHLAAFGRQGVDEIGMALRAFPESIQAQEHGTIFDPTPGEIASGRSTSIYGESFVKGADRGEEQQMAAGKRDFVKEILEKFKQKSGGNSGGGEGKTGYQRAKERSLADEQKDWRQKEDERRGQVNDRDRPGGRDH